MMQPLEQQRDGECVFPRYDRHVTNTSPSRSLSGQTGQAPLDGLDARMYA